VLKQERASLPPDEDDDLVSLTDLADGLLANGKAEGDNSGGAAPLIGERQPADVSEEAAGDTPDEGTDDSEPEEASEGQDAEGEGEGEPSTEPFYTVKIDGKDERVTLKEALAGYQRQADYTRKTEEVANARKVIAAEQAEARRARDEYSRVLGVILERLGPESGEPTAEQWNTLRQSDPNSYATQWADYQRREVQRNAVKEEQRRLANEKVLETAQTVRAHIEGERAKLVSKLPVLAHPEKGPAEMKAMREYASKTFNFSDAELDQAYDHRMLLMLDKARKWDTHQAALAKAKGKIEGATQVSAPGARQPPRAAKTLAKKAAQDKFNKTGNIEDAVSLLFQT
jgi:hypothetical protein